MCCVPPNWLSTGRPSIERRRSSTGTLVWNLIVDISYVFPCNGSIGLSLRSPAQTGDQPADRATAFRRDIPSPVCRRTSGCRAIPSQRACRALRLLRNAALDPAVGIAQVPQRHALRFLVGGEALEQHGEPHAGHV